MRIASIWLPQFPLQSLLYAAPERRGDAIIAFAQSHQGDVIPTSASMSKAARGLGAKSGMTVADAHAIEGVRVEVASPEQLRALSSAVADVLAGFAEAVDIERAGTGACAFFARVPARCRGTSFGNKIADELAALGLHARVGIADDRFTAWAAAVHGSADDRPVVSVPRGGSAQFLAPLPLSLLAIPAEVGMVLASVGVRTLGAFAALPPPSVARAWDADYQMLARGEGGAGNFGYAPAAVWREGLQVFTTNLEASMDTLAARLAARLRAHGAWEHGALGVRWADGSEQIHGLALDGLGTSPDVACVRAVLARAMEQSPIFGLRSLTLDLRTQRQFTASATATGSAGASVGGAAAVRSTRGPADGFARAPMLATGSGPTPLAGIPQADNLLQFPRAVGDAASASVHGGDRGDAEREASNDNVFSLTVPSRASRGQHEGPRRTRRGKSRPRHTMAGQIRLFGD